MTYTFEWSQAAGVVDLAWDGANGPVLLFGRPLPQAQARRSQNADWEFDLLAGDCLLTVKVTPRRPLRALVWPSGQEWALEGTADLLRLWRGYTAI